MQKSIRLSRSGILNISNDTLADLAFIFYFSSGFITFAVGKILSVGGMETAFLSGLLVSAVIYSPMLAYFVSSRGKKIPADALVLLWGIVLFFLITIAVHPEYAYWYEREDYGIVNYVFKPTEALYAYLFVRLINDPERLQKDMKISGWLMYIAFVYQIYRASRLGYWEGVGKTGVAEMSYSVSFGYEVMLYVLPFFYDLLRHRKLLDLAGTAIGLLMILTNGSRGPVLFIGIFVVVYAVIGILQTKRKGLYIALMITAAVLLWRFYIPLLTLVGQIFETLGLSSRFVTKMLSGALLDNNGRIEIWTAALEMIKENPFGYGAMGSQHVITQYHYAGYPHSVILEILIDFGVFAGGLILVFLFWNAFKLLFYKRNQRWLPAFLPFFATSWQLLISLCYWSTPAFWACIAIGVNCCLDNRKTNGKIV